MGGFLDPVLMPRLADGWPKRSGARSSPTPRPHDAGCWVVLYHARGHAQTNRHGKTTRLA